MRNYKKMTGRITALALSMMIVISAFSGVFSLMSSAAVSSGDITVYTDYSNIKKDKVVTTAGNVKAYFNKGDGNGDKEFFQGSPRLSNLNDNNFSSEFETNYSSVPFYDIAAGHEPGEKSFSAIGERYIDGSKRWMSLVLPLEGTTTVEDILVVNHSTPELRTYYYEIFAATTEEDLFNRESLVYTYTNANKDQVQDFHVKDGALKGVQFVGMRVYNPCCEWTEAFVAQYGANQIYPRILEFNVYGTVTKEVLSVASSDDGTIPQDIGNSVSDKIEAKFYKQGVETESYTTPAKLIDGKTDNANGADFMNDKNSCTFIDADGTYHNDGSYYMDFTYTVHPDSTVKKILVVNHGDKTLRTGAYELYAGDDAATLYNAENKIGSFKNTKGEQRQIFTVNDKAGLKKAYIGVRVTNPLFDRSLFTFDYNYSTVRFNELGIFGESSGSSENPDAKYTLTSDEKFTVPTGTKLSTFDPTVTYVNGETVKSMTGLKLSNADTGNEFYTGSECPMTYKENGTLKWYTEADGVYNEILYDFGKVNNVKDFLVFNHKNRNIRLGSFKLYAAEKKEDLYKDTSLVANVKTDGFLRQVVSLKTAVKARYVALKTSDVCYNKKWESANVDTIYPRLSAFAVYGTEGQTAQKGIVKVLDSNAASCEVATNPSVAAGVNYSYKAHGAGTAVMGNMGTNSVDAAGNKRDIFEVLTDAKATGEAEAWGFKFAADDADGKLSEVYTDGSTYFDIIYTLKSKTKLSDIVFVGHKDNIWKSSYELYASNSQETLFDDSSLLYTYNNTEKNRTQHYTLTGYTAKYVAVRITAATTSNNVADFSSSYNASVIYTRLFQFAVYGNYVDPDFDPTANADRSVDTATMDLTQIRAMHPNSLLETAKMTARIDGKKYSISTDKARRWKQLLQTCNGSSHDDHDEFKQGFVNDMIFQINKKYDLTQMNGFVFQGISSDSTPYYASHYQVYMAEEVEDLFLPENMAYEYNEAESQIMKGQYVVFPEGKQPTGNYIGFRIIDPVYTATEHTYLRVSMLYAWGEEAKITPSPANVAENMPIEAYFRNGSKLTEVSNENLTPQELANMTDSNADTYATINTKGSTRNQLELIYNLCNDVDVNGLKINTLINSTIGFKTMKVYAGTGLMQVNDESSLVWTYNVGSKTGTLTPSKTFQKSVKARYVRFVFAGTKDSVRINDIEVIAMDNQKMKTRLITNSLEASSITVTKYDSTKKKTELMIMNQDTLGYAVDNDRTTYITLPGGIVGKDKYNLILQLGGFKTISNITLNLLNNFQEYWPTKMNVYVGDTAEAVEAADAKPLFTFTTKDVKGYSISRQIRPIMTRYFRVEMVDFAKNKYYKNNDGTGMIVHTLADIVLTGTKVNGMNTSVDDERLITFSDKKTGMEVSIQRIDETDVFTDAQAIRVTPEKVTNWQMSSLRASQNKVVGKKTYKLEFLDIYGNVVTDLGGRSILVSFKKPAGSNTCGIGNASQRTKIKYRDSYELSGRVYATESSWSETTDNKFALLEMTTSDDVYWSQIGKLENFKEGNLDDTKTEEELEAEEIYKRSIHTTDGLFSLRFEQSKIPVGAKFTARNDTEYISVETCETLMAYNPDHNLVTRYNVSLVTKDGAPVDREDGELATITMNMPDDMYDNFSDFLVYQEDATGNLSECIDVAAIDRQLVFSMDNVDDMNFVVIGVGAGNGGTNGTNGNGNGGTPATGETATGAAAVLSLMIAAAFVGLRFGKRSKAK